MNLPKLLALFVILPTPASSTAAVSYWDGGGSNDNWSNGVNWVGSEVTQFPPFTDGTAGASFGGITRLTPNLDMDWRLRSLEFNSSAGTFALRSTNDSKLNLGTLGIVNDSALLQSIHHRIVLGDSHVWNALAGPLSITGDVALGTLLTRTLTIDGDFNTSITGSIVGNASSGGGNLIKRGTGILWVTGANQYAGSTTVHAGRLVVDNVDGSATGSGGVIVENAAVLMGSGRVAGGVTLLGGGQLWPGSAIGDLELGSLQLADSARVTWELGGITPGNQYDQLQISTTAAFDGILEVELVSGFTPTVGDAFVLATYASCTGVFDTRVLPPTASPGLFWTVEYRTNQLVLSLTALPGDIDLDGDVDRTDAAKFAMDFGSSDGTWGTGDFNDDGATTVADWFILQTHLGQSIPTSSAAAVPEPAAHLIVLTAGILLAVATRGNVLRRSCR